MKDTMPQQSHASLEPTLTFSVTRGTPALGLLSHFLLLVACQPWVYSHIFCYSWHASIRPTLTFCYSWHSSLGPTLTFCYSWHSSLWPRMKSTVTHSMPISTAINTNTSKNHPAHD